MFNPEYAAPTDWARMYRDLSIQVVPAIRPSEHKSWKRPALQKWRSFESEIASDQTFEEWYGEGGEHIKRNNMGLITGACSAGVFVIDLDLHKTADAQAWWYEMLDLQQKAGELETAEQITGGGGIQLFFRAPLGWVPPTCKTPIGVDIRGQGGFAMMPPSMHQSGQLYRWKQGFEPWNVEIATAPRWLCDQIINLARQYGAKTTINSPSERTKSPTHSLDGFGRMVDGREDFMSRLVWARVVDQYRQNEILPSKADIEQIISSTFIIYEQKVRSRISEPGTSNSDLLEREGRGISLLTDKVIAALSQWDTKIKAHAGVIKQPREDRKDANREPFMAGVAAAGTLPQPSPLFELLSVMEIKNLPDPDWVVRNFIIDRGLGFVFGPPGCGKSFLTQGLSLAISCGLPDWFGRDIVRKGPVIYISSEGVGDFKFRLKAWENHHVVKADDAPFYLIRQTINFMLESDINKLLATINQLTHSLGELPVMVVVDTVSRVLPGADENLQKDMTLFIRACDAVREVFGATVIGVHHTSRQGNMRGSTVFDGAGDFLAQIERDEGDTIGTITAKKIKAAADGWKQAFELLEVGVGDIKGTKSLVAVSRDHQAKDKSIWPSKEVCKRILGEIGKAWVAGKPWSIAPQSKMKGRFAPAIIKSQFDIPEKTAEYMIQQWLQNEVLSYEMRDKSTKLQGLKVIGSID